MFRSHLLIPLLGLLATGCSAGSPAERMADPKSDPKVISDEDRDLLEKIKARERAKAELSANPSLFVVGGAWDSYDKGIINTYTRATAIQFTNQSDFDVSELKGTITYKSANGTELATVPFSATGELRAGRSAKLKVTAGEITGASRTAVTKVESLRILGPA